MLIKKSVLDAVTFLSAEYANSWTMVWTRSDQHRICKVDGCTKKVGKNGRKAMCQTCYKNRPRPARTSEGSSDGSPVDTTHHPGMLDKLITCNWLVLQNPKKGGIGPFSLAESGMEWNLEGNAESRVGGGSGIWTMFEAEFGIWGFERNLIEHIFQPRNRK